MRDMLCCVEELKYCNNDVITHLHWGVDILCVLLFQFWRIISSVNTVNIRVLLTSPTEHQETLRSLLYTVQTYWEIVKQKMDEVIMNIISTLSKISMGKWSSIYKLKEGARCLYYETSCFINIFHNNQNPWQRTILIPPYYTSSETYHTSLLGVCSVFPEIPAICLVVWGRDCVTIILYGQ